MLKFRIKYTWPEGKVRYRKAGGLCQSPEDADLFTWADARDIIKASRDAHTVWRIVTTKERVQ